MGVGGQFIETLAHIYLIKSLLIDEIIITLENFSQYVNPNTMNRENDFLQ